MKKIIIKLFLLLFLFSNNTRAQEFTTIDERHLVLDNGLIKRELYFNNTGQLSSTVLKFDDDNFNFLHDAYKSYEFRLEVNSEKLNGQSQWELLGIDKISDMHRVQGANVRLKSTNTQHDVEVQIRYLIYPDLPVITKQISVINIGKQSVKIEGIDVEAVSLKSFPTSTELYTHYCRNKTIGPYEGDWDDPVIALHLPEISRGVILGNEAPAVLKRIAFYHDAPDFCAGLTHPDQAYPFRKWLKPNESYTSPEVFLLLYKDENTPYKAVNFILPEYVRKYMDLEIFKNKYKPVFVYNTWNPFRKNIDHKMIAELAEAAEECGILEFVIDDGWQLNKFTKKGADVPWWYTQVGDYHIDKDKFPGGLKPVFDNIKEHGMKPGLWLSIGSASITAEVFREHPEWFVRDQDGHLANLHTPSDTTMRTACMSTDWVNHIKKIIIDLEKEHGLTYTKLDFASITSAYVSDPAISGCYATNHTGHKDHAESFIVNYSGLFGLFDELQLEAPDLFIDCTFETQGKLHLIDYAFMKHAEGNWLSNIEEASPVGALRVRHLAWERTPVLPAASLVIGNLRLDSDDLEYDFYSLLGTFPIMLGDIRETNQQDRKWLKSWSDWMLRMQEKYNYMAYRQDLKGFGEPHEGMWDGWQRINTEKQNGGIIGIFRQGSPENSRVITVEGLLKEKLYEVLDASANISLGKFSGLQLKTEGFQVHMDRNYQAKIFEIKGLK